MKIKVIGLLVLFIPVVTLYAQQNQGVLNPGQCFINGNARWQKGVMEEIMYN